MKYTFVFLGNSRTGTTSMWAGLRKHSQISSSLRKERLLQIPHDVNDLEFYIPYNFNLRPSTRVLLEGSPNIPRIYFKFIEYIHKCKLTDRVCYLHTLRDDQKRLDSFIVNMLASHYRNYLPRPWWIDENDELIEDNLIYELTQEAETYEKIRQVEDLIGKDNIFVVRLEKLNDYMKELQEFFRIDYEDIKIGWLNKINTKFPTIDCVRLYRDYRNIVEERMSEIIKDNNQKIYERYKVHE